MVPVDFHVLEVIEYEGSQYIALVQAEPTSMTSCDGRQGETVELAVIEDDELFEKVAQKFDEIFSAEADEEEEA